MQVDVDAVVEYAGEVWENSYAVHAIMLYEEHIGNAPAIVWGKLPWSDEWRVGWTHSVKQRMTEAKTLRDVLNKTGGLLVQSAADYSHKDVSNALDLEKISPEVDEFRSELLKSGNEISAKPGGKPPSVSYPDSIFYDKGDPLGKKHDVDLGPELKKLEDDWDPKKQPHYESTHDNEGADRNAIAGPENDELDKFVKDNWGYFPDVDAAAKSRGVKQPFKELIEAAWWSMPSAVERRANLFFKAGDTFSILKDELEIYMTPELLKKWTGSRAATAFESHSNAVHKYHGTCHEEVKWLANQGIKVAKLLKALRSKYAEIGLSHIVNIREEIQKLSSNWAKIASCTSQTGAISALADMAVGFSEALTTAQSNRDKEAKEILAAKFVVDLNKPDFESFEHNAQPFPESPDGYSKWDDAGDWR